jgi:drug/metabolite transporter (DMT)-like permease
LDKRKPIIGIAFAVVATLIWSGNFIVARGVIKDIPPVTLAFYRWLVATIIIIPLAWKTLVPQINIVRHHLPYFLAASATGISIFNTFVYIGAHYSEAINLALLGTTSSPIMSVVLARIFHGERITKWTMTGMLLCVLGILLLLSKGDLRNLQTFSFSKGDWWVLAAALSFAVYNTMIKKRPAQMESLSFLSIIFFIGTLLLFPFYLFEYSTEGGFNLSLSNMLFILYLGLGASVICFIFWNKAIAILGTGRAALFGNLIPVFSTIEAVLILGEKINWVHIVSFAIVISGLLLANLRKGT